MTRCVLESVLEDVTVEWIADTIIEASKRRSAQSQLADYEKRLADTKKQIRNIVRAVEMGIISDEFKERMAELEETKKELRSNITTARILSYTWNLFGTGTRKTRSFKGRSYTISSALYTCLMITSNWWWTLPGNTQYMIVPS